MRNRMILLVLAAILGGGTAHAQVTTRDHRPEAPRPPPPPPEEAAPTWDATGWTLLGSATVQGRRDKDTIKVGRYEGQFDQIVLVVDGADLEVKKLVVHFGNKEKFKPKLRHTFDARSRSRVIDLPGRDRTIARIDLKYRKLERGKRAVVRVYGRDTRNDRDRDRDRDRWDPKGWEKLGELRVSGKRDRDTLKVGRDDGRFEKLMFAVEDSDIELYDVVVTFGNGETFEPKTRLTFREGSRTRGIDLPGDKRFIKRIDFKFGNLPGGGKATVVVWGKPAGGKHQDEPPPPPPVWDDRGWTFLGETTVQGKGDLDMIKVSGEYTKLTLVVLDSDLELHDLVVHFEHGKPHNPKLKHVFKEGARARAIDLPGKVRHVTQVDLSYGNLPGGGRARVQVWGKR